MPTEPNVYERILAAVERYGYGLTLAAAVLWFARTDIILPMVSAHRELLTQISESYRALVFSQEELDESIRRNAALLEQLLEAQKHGGK